MGEGIVSLGGRSIERKTVLSPYLAGAVAFILRLFTFVSLLLVQSTGKYATIGAL